MVARLFKLFFFRVSDMRIGAFLCSSCLYDGSAFDNILNAFCCSCVKYQIDIYITRISSVFFTVVKLFEL